MRNMLSGHFAPFAQINIVYHRVHQREHIRRIGRTGVAYTGPPPGEAFRKASPNGIPLTLGRSTTSLKCSQMNIVPHRTNTRLLLLKELYMIATCVVPHLRDSAMTHITSPRDLRSQLYPMLSHPFRALPHFGRPRKTLGLVNVGPHRALHIDEMARYAILYGRPGPNFFVGVVMDHAFRVQRRSIFGFGLVRSLCPDGKTSVFRRLVACLFALLRRYHEAIEDFNARDLFARGFIRWGFCCRTSRGIADFHRLT